MKHVKLDRIDLRILRELQKDGRMTNVELAKHVGISAPPCLRRVRALEESGYIRGYHADVAYFIKERGVSFIGGDGPNDVVPTGLPETVTNPLHRLALVAMGVSIFDNLDFERAAEQAKRLNRYEFLFTAAPLRIEKGTGSPLNPLAIF